MLRCFYPSFLFKYEANKHTSQIFISVTTSGDGAFSHCHTWCPGDSYSMQGGRCIFLLYTEIAVSPLLESHWHITFSILTGHRSLFLETKCSMLYPRWFNLWMPNKAPLQGDQGSWIRQQRKAMTPRIHRTQWFRALCRHQWKSSNAEQCVQHQDTDTKPGQK